MSGDQFLELSMIITFFVLSLSLLLVVGRIVRGPSLPDRIMGLDLLVFVAIGYIAVFGIRTGFTIYVDIAIALGLVGFLSTVALARFVLQRGDVSLGDGSGDKRDGGEGDGR